MLLSVGFWVQLGCSATLQRAGPLALEMKELFSKIAEAVAALDAGACLWTVGYCIRTCVLVVNSVMG